MVFVRQQQARTAQPRVASPAIRVQRLQAFVALRWCQEVVALEHAVDLAAAGGDDDRARVDVQRLVGVDGDRERPFEDAGRGGIP